MKNVKDKVISIIIISTLFLTAWVTAGFASNHEVKSQSDTLFVTISQAREINPDFVKKSIRLYQNLSEDKKAVIQEKMSKMSQERQKAIEAIGQQIKEYKLKNMKQKQITSHEERINRLQALQQFALKENAPQIAKRFEKIISLYEDIKARKSFIGKNL